MFTVLMAYELLNYAHSKHSMSSQYHTYINFGKLTHKAKIFVSHVPFITEIFIPWPKCWLLKTRKTFLNWTNKYFDTGDGCQHFQLVHSIVHCWSESTLKTEHNKPEYSDSSFVKPFKNSPPLDLMVIRHSQLAFWLCGRALGWRATCNCCAHDRHRWIQCSPARDALSAPFVASPISKSSPWSFTGRIHWL